MTVKPTEQYLTPAAGLRVIDPATGAPLPAKGTTVRGQEIWWSRRLRDGEVTEGRPKDKPQAQAATKSQESTR